MSVPKLDPTEPGIYGRILATAQRLRAERGAVNVVQRAQVRARLRADLAAAPAVVPAETEAEASARGRYWRTVAERD